MRPGPSSLPLRAPSCSSTCARSGSVTARRPVGTTALAALAVWLLLGSVLYDVLGDRIWNDAAPVLTAFTYVDAFVQFALALVAVVQIARLGVMPAPWNRVPAWIVAAVSVTWLLLQLMGGGTIVYGPGLVTWFLTGLDGLARVGGTALLGVIAIVLADRATGRSVATPVAGVHDAALTTDRRRPIRGRGLPAARFRP